MADTAATTELIEVLDAYLDAHARGEAPDRAELLAAHPECASQIENCLASLEFVTAVVKPLVATQIRSPAAGSATAPPRTIGDFRLVRRVGQGGMGIVYEAWQQSLSRRVALKVLPFAPLLDARQVTRFKNEAQAAASLDHHHIVSVYAVGSDHGLHYYAMQFVDGLSLAELIRLAASRPLAGGEPVDPPDVAQLPAELSTLSGPAGPAYFRRVAAVVRDVAQALHHAHQLGVVHRDIKPANLLVDTAGNVFVADFGLATTQANAGLTLTGDVVGTLRYMSPEQALGNEAVIDFRTDIYSLGLTLYELLTRQPAFVENDRGHLLRRILEDAPPRPTTMDAAVPRDLETITLKAIAREPEARYLSMAEFADDLSRFLASRPIRARRPNLVEAGFKWFQQHTAVTWSAVTIAALLMVILLVAYVREARLHQQTDVYREQATRSSGLAWDVTFGVLQKMTHEIEFLPHTAVAERNAIDRALARYRAHAGAVGAAAGDYLTQRSIAELLLLKADNSSRIRCSMLEDAEAAIAILKPLAAADPADPSVRQDLANAYFTIARHFFYLDMRNQDAVDACVRAANLMPGEILDFWLVRPKALWRLGRSREAEQYLLERLRTIRELESAASTPSLQRREAQIRRNLVPIYEALGKWDQAVSSADEALGILAKLEELASLGQADAKPVQRDLHFVVAAIVKSRICGQIHDPVRGESLARQAITILKACPAPYDWIPKELAWSFQVLGDSLVVAGKFEDAEQAYLECIPLLLDDGTPPDVYRAGLIRFRLAQLLERLKRHAEASQLLASARNAFEQAAARYPAEPFCNLRLVVLLTMAPQEEFRDGERALELAQRTLTTASGLHSRYLALAQLRCGAAGAAIESARRAMSLRNGGDSIDRLILALALHANGNDVAAREMLAAAERTLGEPVFFQELGPLAASQLLDEARQVMASDGQN